MVFLWIRRAARCKWTGIGLAVLLLMSCSTVLQGGDDNTVSASTYGNVPAASYGNLPIGVNHAAPRDAGPDANEVPHADRGPNRGARAGHTSSSRASKGSALSGRHFDSGKQGGQNGSFRAIAAGGGSERAVQVTLHPNGRPETIHLSNGEEADFRSDGSIRTVRGQRMTVTHGPTGVDHIVAERPGNRIIVTDGAGNGYLQRPLLIGNRRFVQRTYYAHGATYARLYRPYTYRGVVLSVYTPIRYYPPAFYEWALNQWSAPIAYTWGWAGSEWFGFYGKYFAPYSTYASALYWLADYLVASTLQEAYEERMAASAQISSYAGYAPVAHATLTPEVKQQIAEEVRRELEQERAENQAPLHKATAHSAEKVLPALTGNNPHVFVVSTDLEVLSGGEECAITEGDVLRLDGPAPPDALDLNLRVLASKSRDCRVGSVVAVELQDATEMQNHMRETIDSGLEYLQSWQGARGLSALPAEAAAPAVDEPYAAGLRPEGNIESELRQQVQAAGIAEQQLVNEALAAETGPALATKNNLTADGRR